MHIEDRRLLKLAADAKLGNLCLIKLGEIVGTLFEIDVACVRPGFAGDDIHHRGLAGTVRSDNRTHFARLDHERQLVERPEAVERHCDAVEIEQGGGRFRLHTGYSAACGAGAGSAMIFFSARRSCQCWKVPTIPRGSRSVTAMNIPPSTNSQ